MRALVIDDSLLTRSMITDLLVMEGIETHSFDSAEKGLAEYEQNFYDLVLLDWELPGKSGIEACQIIRNQAQSQYTVILMITSRKEESDLREILAAGADDYLAKPFQSEFLKVRLKIAKSKVYAFIKRQEAERRLQQNTLLLKRLNEKLQNNQKELVEVEKMASMGRLAAGTAHHFNSLLGGILGYALLLKEKLKKDPKLEKLKSFAEKIEKSATQGGDLTHKLLDFSQSESSESIETEAVQLSSLLENSIANFNTALFENVSFKCESKCKNNEAIWDIQVNPQQLMKVIKNICLNSIESMPKENTPSKANTILCTLENKIITQKDCDQKQYYKIGHFVHLVIQDNGKGIDENHISQVFDPFYSTKPIGENSGLGLTYVYGVIKSHGGFLEIKNNTTGPGTSIHLYLLANQKNSKS